MEPNAEGYIRMKQVVHCEVNWKVKDSEDKDNGALHHKVWNPGRLQLKKSEDNETYGQQQTRVWDPGKMKIEGS